MLSKLTGEDEQFLADLKAELDEAEAQPDEDKQVDSEQSMADEGARMEDSDPDGSEDHDHDGHDTTEIVDKNPDLREYVLRDGWDEGVSDDYLGSTWDKYRLISVAQVLAMACETLPSQVLGKHRGLTTGIWMASTLSMDQVCILFALFIHLLKIFLSKIGRCSKKISGKRAECFVTECHKAHGTIEES